MYDLMKLKSFRPTAFCLFVFDFAGFYFNEKFQVLCLMKNLIMNFSLLIIIDSAKLVTYIFVVLNFNATLEKDIWSK